MLNVIYEDNHIIVVEKPVNVPSQEDKTGDKDMLTEVKDYLKVKYNKPGNVYVGLVHRLDRPVGGIMIFAKTSKAASRLSESIRVKDFKKTIQNGVQRFQLFAHLGKDSDDIECLFIERMNQLLKKGAYVGIVLPTTLLESTKSHMYARKYMLDNFRFVGLVKLSDQAFMKTDTKTVVLFLEKVGNSNNDNLKKRIDLFFNDINVLVYYLLCLLEFYICHFSFF